MSLAPRYPFLRRFPWLNFILWAALFAAAYAQSPLFTSNQNQYFLPGLARAGYGDLAGDWLANTQDPTPVFSALVAASYWIFRRVEFFYLEYALLMGVYVTSALGIAQQLFPRPWRRWQRLAFLALCLLVHAAGWRFLLSRLLGVEWTYVLEDGFASQRMLGPVLQPSAFGVFLLLSVYLYLCRSYYWAAVAAVLAATVHPTYLLSAALLVLAYLLHLLLVERRGWLAVGVGGLALLLVSPTVYFTLQVFGGQPELAEQARRVLVEYRIPHHALVAEWWNGPALVKSGLILAALYLARRTRLAIPFLVTGVAIILLTLAQIFSGSLALALLFPWRPSVYLLPLAILVILSWLVSQAARRAPVILAGRARLIAGLSWLVIGLAVLVGLTRFALDLERKAGDPERAVEAYVAVNRQPGQAYLTPVKMQDFRLEAGAAAYVDFKSIPYRNDEVLEWYRRVQSADRFYKRGDCAWLAELAQAGEVTHVVWPQENGALDCDFLESQYADDSYILYRLPQASAAVR